jgi:outer membrane protein TolC
MRKVCIFALIFLGTSCLAALAQEELQEITLTEYLGIVQANHPYFSKEQLAVNIEQKQAQSLLGDKDWFLSLVPSYSYLGKASAPEISGGAVEQLNRAGFEASINKNLWSSGGRLGFSWTSGYTRSDILVGHQDVYRNGVGATYTQPFLQNWKGKLDRLQYELSDYIINSTQLQVWENQENFLYEVSVRFLDWAYYTRELSIRKGRLEIAKQGLDEVNKRFKANLVDKVDVLRAEDSVRLAEQGVVLSRSQWKAKQAELAVIAGSDEIVTRWPQYDIYSLEQLPDREQSVKELKSESRLLQTLHVLRKQLEYQKTGVEDQKRAQLDLSVTAGIYGRDQTLVEALAIYQPEVIVSLIFAKPLGSRTAKGQLEKIDAQIAQVDGEVESIERDLESALVNLLIQIQDLEEVLDLNRKQIESALEKTKEELKLYNQGRSQLTFVIQSEDNEEAARLTYAGNAYLYHSLILQYQALLDRILVIE